MSAVIEHVEALEDAREFVKSSGLRSFSKRDGACTKITMQPITLL